MIKSKQVFNSRTLKASNVVLVMLVILLGLIGGKLLLHWQDHKVLLEEISYLNASFLQAPVDEAMSVSPQMSDLLMAIDECVRIFSDEDITIRSYNLESIREEGGGQSALRSGLIRFLVQGSWTGIERGLSRMESRINQGVHVEEVSLDKDGGEILLKIFFYGTK